MSDSEEIIKEMLEQGIITDDSAQEQLEKLNKKSGKSDVKDVCTDVMQAVKQAIRKVNSKADTESEDAEAEAPKAAEQPQKEKKAVSKRGDARAGNETVGMYAARLYGDEIELTPGNFVSVKELIDGIHAKKIVEKAFDLVRFLRMKVKMSCYTSIGFKELSRCNKMTLPLLFQTMENGTYGVKYSEGTARSQSQQVHSLFKTFKIIDDNGDEIKDSPVLDCIRKYGAGENASVLRREIEKTEA